MKYTFVSLVLISDKITNKMAEESRLPYANLSQQ